MARAMLERYGRLAVAVIANPGELGADLLTGYTVILDPRRPLGEVHLR